MAKGEVLVTRLTRHGRRAGAAGFIGISARSRSSSSVQVPGGTRTRPSRRHGRVQRICPSDRAPPHLKDHVLLPRAVRHVPAPRAIVRRPGTVRACGAGHAGGSRRTARVTHALALSPFLQKLFTGLILVGAGINYGTPFSNPTVLRG